MKHNRIPRRVLAERDQVMARVRQNQAYDTYSLNIRRTELASQVLEVRPDLAGIVARLAPTTALIHV